MICRNTTNTKFYDKKRSLYQFLLDKGIMTLSVYEPDNSKQGEDHEFLGNYMAIFFGIPDFKYKFKALMNVAIGA